MNNNKIPIGKNMIAKNVLGNKLEICNYGSKTGFLKDGFCNSFTEDKGLHIICSLINDKFLNFTKTQGIDLTTPKPEHNFPGLKTDDRWCIRIATWLNAAKHNAAPRIRLEACHESVLQYISLNELKQHI